VNEALFVLVLLRYRAMIPLMYVVIVAHYVASRGVGYMKPRAGRHVRGENSCSRYCDSERGRPVSLSSQLWAKPRAEPSVRCEDAIQGTECLP
jgi:hypothetical protein